MTVVRKHNGSFAKNNLHKTIRYRDFKHFDEHQFVEQLTNVPWSLLSIADDVDVKVDLFEQLYLSVLNEHAPIVEKRVKSIRQPPWFNADLGKQILERDRLFNSYKHSHDPNALTAYKRANNHVNHEIRKAKREFYIKTLEQQRPNPRVLWSHIKSSLASTTAVQPRQTNIPNQPQPQSKMMADKFNYHFVNIVSTFGAMPTTVPNYAKLRNFISRSKSENANFKLPNMTIEFVLKQLRAMPAAKATGLDGISCKVLKLSAEIIAPHIVNICNTSIETAQFPRSWKKARVVPLYKSGDSNDVTNYRPISVLPVLSKLLERHVYNHFYAYLADYQLLLEEQSGFRQNRSCETLLIKLTDYILNNIDNGNLCGMVLVDLRKAFDLVDHELMLIKLDMYGCQGKELAWFKSYLSERFQSVKYDGVLSDPLPVTIGVPQGSILGPLLFITFMNDSILEISDMRFDMYADDSTLYTAGKCVGDINRSLTTKSKPLYNWIDANRMVLNAEKTECMLLGTRQKLRSANAAFCVHTDNGTVTSVDTHKLLGLHVDNSLTWSVHVTKLCSKLRSRLYLFNQVKRLMPIRARKLYFSGMVQPVIDYGCVIWGSCGHVLLLNVHKMMKQYARVILNVKDKREVSTVSLFRTLGWLPIDVRIHYFTAVAMFNIMIGQAPIDLVNMFTQTNSVHDHNTRGGTNIRVKRYNLSIGQRTFAYRGAKVWDNIPEHIKNVTTVECFKTMFLKHVSKEVYECEHFKIDRPA